MTKEQIAAVNKRLEDGEKLTTELYYKLVNANQGLIYTCINQFNIQQEYVKETLKVECEYALENAILKFDPAKKVKFSTLATTYIKQDILNQLKKLKKEKIFVPIENLDEMQSSIPDVSEEIIKKEAQIESYNQLKQILLDKKKNPKDVEIYLYWKGIQDNKRKTIADVSKIYKRKISSLNKLFASCNRIIREHYDPEGSNKKWAENAIIKEQDLILMNFIIESNKIPESKNPQDLKKKYPNRKTILEELTYFGSVDAISDSISRLINIKGCKIIKENQWQGYHITNPDEVTKMTNQEIIDISILLNLMEQYKNTPLEDTFKNVWNKICQSMLGIVSEDKIKKENYITVITDPLASINKDVFDNVLTACRENKTIEFTYHSQYSNTISTRQADPYHIVYYDGSWYLLGFCHKSNKFLWFAFPRFSNISIKEKFTPQQGFKLENYFDKKHGILWQTDIINVELKFPANLALYASERNWGDNQSVQKLSNGEVIIKFSTVHEPELLRLIMKFSPDIQVISPQSIKDKIKKMAESTMLLY